MFEAPSPLFVPYYPWETSPLSSKKLRKSMRRPLRDTWKRSGKYWSGRLSRRCRLGEQTAFPQDLEVVNFLI
jgi:hypothetical protein